MNTKEMSVAEIKQKLINEYNADPNLVLNMKGKTNLVNFMFKLAAENGEVSESFKILDNEELKGIETINRFSKGWTQYILNQLEDDEKDQQYPKTCGLGRLLEKEISPIASIESVVIQAPCNDNNMMATVKTRLVLENGEIYEACADAQKGNLEYPYDRHVTAIAETRSEGRVYRRALKLKGVVTKEEMIEKVENQEDNKITKQQIMLIDNLCGNDRLNINVNKLLKLLFGEESKKDINTYLHEEAASIVRKLTEYQGDLSKIPNDIKGFDPSWK